MTTVATVEGPVSDLDPFSDAFVVDPFPELVGLRAMGPAVHLSRYDAWAVAAHAEVHALLRDHRRFSSAAGVGLGDLRTAAYGWRKPSLLLEVDPPDHARYRGVVVGAMTPRALRVFEEDFAVEARRIVDDLVGRGSFDAVTDLAEVFPTVVFPRALGVQGDVREPLLAYGALSFNAIGPRNQRLEASLVACEGVLEWITDHCRREALREGSIGAGIHDAATAAGLSDDHAASLVRSLFSAGVDTTVSALSFAVLDFLHHPEQWDLVRNDPELARSAFEETVRFESPVIGFFRTTTEEVRLGDARIPADAKVLALYAGANRDPAHWPDPDRYDVQRRTAGHLGYGVGPHVCAGMSLARLEGQVVISALAERIAGWEPAGEVVPRLNNALRSLTSLPVRVAPRDSAR
ncbi:MAG TPA: cytochrome P450 [Pseudonocardia sp.]